VNAWFHHWIIVDFYDPVWPNIAASILCAVWAVRRIKIHLRRHHQLMVHHFSPLHGKHDDLNSGRGIGAGTIPGGDSTWGSGRNGGGGRVKSETRSS
jgi:hypothetical protein